MVHCLTELVSISYSLSALFLATRPEASADKSDNAQGTIH